MQPEMPWNIQIQSAADHALPQTMVWAQGAMISIHDPLSKKPLCHVAGLSGCGRPASIQRGSYGVLVGVKSMSRSTGSDDKHIGNGPSRHYSTAIETCIPRFIQQEAASPVKPMLNGARVKTKWWLKARLQLNLGMHRPWCILLKRMQAQCNHQQTNTMAVDNHEKS